MEPKSHPLKIKELVSGSLKRREPGPQIQKKASPSSQHNARPPSSVHAVMMPLFLHPPFPLKRSPRKLCPLGSPPPESWLPTHFKSSCRDPFFPTIEASKPLAYPKTQVLRTPRSLVITCKSGCTHPGGSPEGQPLTPAVTTELPPSVRAHVWPLKAFNFILFLSWLV